LLTIKRHVVVACLRAFSEQQEYKTAKYLPLDLRAKQTRAIRRRLTPAQVRSLTSLLLHITLVMRGSGCCAARSDTLISKWHADCMRVVD
jgi:hypothetical protein